jgi:hypothetical protein
MPTSSAHNFGSAYKIRLTFVRDQRSTVRSKNSLDPIGMAANRMYPMPNAPNYGQQPPRGSAPNGVRYTYPPGSSPSAYPSTVPPNQGPMRQPYYPQANFAPPLTTRVPSAGLQGTFSTYPARLRQSDNNALLLPVSYMGPRKAKFTGASDDEFEDFDDNENGTPFSGTRTRAQAQQQQQPAGSQAMVAAGSGGTPVSTELRKIPRRRNFIHTNEEELMRGSDVEEVLVPIRLDLDLDDIKLRDVFMWNMNGEVYSATKDCLFEAKRDYCFRAIPDAGKIW